MIRTDKELAQITRLEELLHQALDRLGTSPYQGDREWREFLHTNQRGQYVSLRRERTEYERVRRPAGLRPPESPTIDVQLAKIRKVDLQMEVIERSLARIVDVIQEVEFAYPVNVVKLSGAREEYALYSAILAAWQAHRNLLARELPRG